jgi:hypothetical protein
MICIVTVATPTPSIASLRAAARDRSISRPRTYGPRSLIRTATHATDDRQTCTMVPKGNVREAAVIASGLKRSPFAVFCGSPYHDARSACAGMATHSNTTPISMVNRISPPVLMVTNKAAHIDVAAIGMPPSAAVRQAKLPGEIADVIHHRISLVAGLLPHVAGPAPMVQRVPHVPGRGIAVDRRQAFMQAKQCREEAGEAIGEVACNCNHLAVRQWFAYE